VLQRVRPVLEAVRDETGETVTLSKIQGSRLICLLVIDSPQVIRPVLTAGTLRPLHSTATGKALLSTLDDAVRKAVLEEAGLAKLTSKTIVSRTKLDAQIKESAARGWFQNEGESVPELSGVAVPLKISNDAYAISVMGPSYRMDGHQERFAQVLMGAREAIGQGL